MLLYILQCWSACEVDKDNRALPMVMYFSGMIYKYNFYLEFIPVKKNEEGKEIHDEIFNNIPHFIKNCLYVKCLQYNFVM